MISLYRAVVETSDASARAAVSRYGATGAANYPETRMYSGNSKQPGCELAEAVGAISDAR